MAKSNVLVIDGGEVKFRLEAERQASTSLIHIDWLRFTVFVRNVVPTFETLPDWRLDAGSKWERHLNKVEFGSAAFDYLSAPAQSLVIRSTLETFEADRRESSFQAVASQAFDLAREVAKNLGAEFVVNTSLKPGQDFYKYRIAIERHGHECAWVGFLASGNGKSKGSQDQTIHVNIQGHACTFAAYGWREKMAASIKLHAGRITRCDLALDLFDGLGYSFGRLLDDYKAGVFKVRGKNPACALAGDWCNDCARSLYIGSRASGKITNIYEKGDALFGIKAMSKWIRAELRYGDQLRVLECDILTNPDSYFAGASEWHEALLAQAGATVNALPIRTTPTLEKQTVAAEVTRNLRWLRDSAAATVSAALKYMDYDSLIQFLNPDSPKVPGRLSKFKPSELVGAYASVLAGFNTAGSAPARFQVAV